MIVRFGPLKIPWIGKDSHKDDPYWDFFVNTPPADLTNMVTEMIRNAPDGNVFPTKAELHTPEITSSHVKGMAEYFGAELVGIAKLNVNESNSAEAVNHTLSPLFVRCALIMIRVKHQA